MKLSRVKRAYLRAHYRDFTDAKLTKALGIGKDEVREELKRLGLRRTPEELEGIARQEVELPPFTGHIPAPSARIELVLRHYLTAALVAAIALTVYAIELPPTVTGEDSGELTTAAYTLGIPHPPGYPIWCLFTHPFTYIPHGSVAWRVALASAAFSSAAVFLVALLAMKLTRSAIGGATAGVALAFSREFWEQAVIAEVYGLNSLFLVLCVFLLYVWYETHRNSVLLVFAVVYGLSLCNHNTMLLLGPLFVLFVLSVDREPWRRWKLYAACTLLALSMLTVYAYLPIRSAANPPVDWGNPETWENFKDVVTRKQYTFGLKEQPRTPARFVEQIGVFLGEFGKQWTWWLAWLPVAGAGVLWRRNRHWTVFLAAVFAAMSFGFILITNFEITHRDIWVNGVFWIPAYIVAALLIGAVIGGLAQMHWRDASMVPAAIPMVIACGVIPAAANYYSNDKSEYYFAYDYAMNAFKTMEPNTIYFPEADHATFPAIYLQAVEGVRPDVTIANKYGYPEQPVYADMPRSTTRHFNKIPNEAQEQQIEDWIITNTDRPVYSTRKRDMHGLPGTQMVDAGLLYRVKRSGEEWISPDYWSQYEWKTLETADARGDYSAELILADYWFARGRELLGLGEMDEGVKALAKSVLVLREAKEALNNAGSACAEHGAFKEAAGFYAKTLEADPKYDTGLRNLAQVFMQSGNVAQAYEQFDQLGAIGKATKRDLLMSVECLKKMSRPDDALKVIQNLIRLEPQDDKLFREAGMVYLNEKHSPDVAQVYFQQSLSLNPDQPDLMVILKQDQAKQANEPEVPSVPNPTASIPSAAPPMPQPVVPGLPSP